MRPLRVAVLWVASLLVDGASGAARPQTFGGATPIEWSVRMARAEMARRGASLEYSEGTTAKWDYASGLFAFALERLGIETKDAALTDYGARIVESFIAPDGSIRTYDAADYNLDMVLPGRAILLHYEMNGEPRLREAAGILRRQLATQPRTCGGGFWHKLRYPDQVWLDGLYMASPFLARYGSEMGEPAACADAVRQIRLADEKLWDPDSGLYFHGWDAQHVQEWADVRTGRSRSFWGRAIGWYAMAVADAIDDIPRGTPDAKAMADILARIGSGIVRWQDPQSGVWWQVVDQGGRPGNYLEASASSMYVYTLAKSISRGILPREKYLPAVVRAYAGLIRVFVLTDSLGQVSLTRCCSVAGLGGTSAAGRVRDGSFEYYVTEPVVENDLKGIAPFVLAGIEVQHVLGSSKN